MAIADELVAVLKVDNSQLLEGLKKAQAGLQDIQKAMKEASEDEKRLADAQEKARKATAEATKDTRAASEAFKKFSGSLSSVRSSFLSLRTIMTGFLVGTGISRLTESVTKISNLSQITGQSVGSIRALGNVFEQLGYSAGEANGTIQSISDALANANYGGASPGALIPFLNFGIQTKDKDGNPRDTAEMLIDLGEAVQKSSKNIAEARMKLKAMGFDNASIAFMTADNPREMLAQQRANAEAYEQQAEAARKLNGFIKELEQTFTSLGVQALPVVEPIVKDVTDGLQKLVAVANKHPEGAQMAIKAIGAVALLAKGPVGALIVALEALREWYLKAKDWLANGNEIQKNVVSGEYEGNTVDPSNYNVDPKSEKTGDWGTGFYKTTSGWLDSGIKAFKDAWGEDPVVGGVPGNNGKNKASQAIDFFVSKGYSADEAKAITANLQGESSFDEKAVGDGGKAYGLAQWHPDRQAQFRKLFNKDIRAATFQEQLEFVDWELRNTHQKALREMRKARTLGDKTGAITRHYEIPADITGASAKRAQIAMGYGNYQPQMVAMANAQPSVVNNTTNQTTNNTLNLTVADVKEAKEIVGQYTSGQKTNRRMASGTTV
jgi:hypothetical protein